MLHTVYSNSYDVLKAVLVFQVLKDMRDRAQKRPGDDEAAWLHRVFETCEVIVPSRLVELDVHRSICQAGIGVSMTVKTSTSLNWETTLTHLQGSRSRDIERLTWEIYGRLSASGVLARFESLKEFLCHCDANPVHRFDAARYLAGLFSKYLAYRTDWLYQWEHCSGSDAALAAFLADDAAAWQLRLWKDIQASERGAESAGLSASRLFANYRSLCERARGVDPSPLYLFMPSQFPSIMPPFIARLAQERDLWVFVNNPCLTDWFSRADGADGGAVQHYLDTNAGALKALVLRLFSLGQRESAPAPEAASFIRSVAFDGEQLQARDLRYWSGSWSGYFRKSRGEDTAGDSDALPEHTSVCRFHRSSGTLSDVALDERLAFDREEIERYLRQERGAHGALGALQQAICENDDALLPDAIDPDDASIRLIEAPDETREVEAIVDVLDDLLAAYQPDDILVAFPDISEKSALIEGVFARRNADKRRQPIPIRIEGEPLVRSNLAAKAFLDAGRLLLGNCSAASFEAWLELPAVLEALSMDLVDLGIARDWLVRAGFSLGLSKSHSMELGFGTDNEASLEDALLRLSLGWATDPEYASVLACRDAQGVDTCCCPIDASRRNGFDAVSARPELLLRLMRLYRTLEDARLEVSDRRRKMAQWGEWTLGWFDRLFEKGDVDTLARVRSVLVSVASSDAEPELDFALFWHMLESRFGDERTGGVQRLAVTFASICDVHAMSHKVVIAAGLSEKARFPGNQVYGEFDLMNAAQHPDLPMNRRRSDRDSRIDNRSDFFELMLCAKERFYMTYCVGARVEHREEPSAVVKDFLELLTAEAKRVDLREGSKRAAAIRASITRRVPLCAVSPEAFLDKPDVLPSFDIGLAQTLRSLQRAASLQEDVLFPTAAFDGGRLLGEDRFTVDARTLASFLYDPDAWILKASGLGSVWEAARLEPTLTEESDSRIQYEERKEAFERLSDLLDAVPASELRTQGVAGLEAALRLRRADPKYGIRPYRERGEFPETVWSAYVRYREETAQGVAQTIPAAFTLAAPDAETPAPTLKESSIPLYRGSDGGLRAVCLCHSGRDLMRAALLGLLLKAHPDHALGPIDTVVLSTRFEEAQASFVHESDSTVAARMLRVALSIYAETVCRDKTLRVGVVPTLSRGAKKPGQQVHVPSGVLWRGIPNPEARTLYALAERLDWYRATAMPPEGKTLPKSPSEVASEFEAAAETLLRLHDVETPYRLSSSRAKEARP